MSRTYSTYIWISLSELWSMHVSFVAIRAIWRLFSQNLIAHFFDYWIQIGEVILLTPKQEVERRRMVTDWRRNFFRLTLVRMTKQCLDKNSHSFLRFFGLRAAIHFTFNFNVFQFFWIFFLIVCPNYFSEFSRTSFSFFKNVFEFETGFCYFFVNAVFLSITIFVLY